VAELPQKLAGDVAGWTCLPSGAGKPVNAGYFIPTQAKTASFSSLLPAILHICYNLGYCFESYTGL